MVSQHGDRGWNRTNVPIDINPFITSPWKVVPNHSGLRPLLFTNSSVGSFTSHKNQNSERGKWDWA